MKSFVDISRYLYCLLDFERCGGLQFFYTQVALVSLNVEWQEENLCFVPGGEST